MTPRFMTDKELRSAFGLTEDALKSFRVMKTFPQRDPIVKKTDTRAVERFFDQRSGVAPTVAVFDAPQTEWEENFA